MKNEGILLWEKAKKIIPGGNQLLSKRTERFLPGLWPSYYKKAKGCEVWDLDGNKYYDFAGMGVGSCILGYADEDVDKAVINAINLGSMSTLNSYEEVELSQKLLSLHPWAEMVRFSRTGGEACAIAVRIAKADSGRDRVAFCGYHGWHDWYLSSNLADTNNLDGQLLPGLEPRGVPRFLKNTALPFNYNKIEELEKIVKDYPGEIGVIIMEPRRGQGPKDGFLEKVRAIADRIGAVLIFDEVTSGFRINLGGIHLTMGVNPDMAVFGKALGNGYAISAIIGKKNVMDNAQTSFISSTFWTERIGFAAALASLNKMEKENAQKKMIEYGELISKGRERIANNYGIQVSTGGIPSFNYFSFNYKNALAIQTYYIQEMLRKGFLLDMSIATSLAYSEETINKFLAATEVVFKELKKLIENNSVESKLENEIRHSGFKRLTE